MRFLAFALLAGLAACRRLLPRQVNSIPPPQAFNTPSPGVPSPFSTLYGANSSDGYNANVFLSCRSASKCIYYLLWGSFSGGYQYRRLTWKRATTDECENSSSEPIIVDGYKCLTRVANGTVHIDYETYPSSGNASLNDVSAVDLDLSTAAATNTNASYIQQRCMDKFFTEPLDSSLSFEKIWDV